ncbi:MAG: peptidylprolyl isomerase [Pseudomonadota bacterium]
MNQATSGQTVRIHYTGRFENGDVFDSSLEREPLAFTLGSGQVIPGMDEAVTGMAVGDKQSVSIAPENGYGVRDERLIQEVPNDALPDDLAPAVGMQLQSQTPSGQVMQLVVVEVGANSITVDANHPLAGKVLEFDIELVAID